MRLAVPSEIDPGALDGWRPGAPMVELGGHSMGTGWRVKLAAPPVFDRAALADAIENRLEAIVDEMSHWRTESSLGRFNRSAAGRWTALPRDFAHVLQASWSIAERSDGAFDPAIGALVNAWGFGPEPVEAPPNAAAIALTRARSGFRRLAFDHELRRLRQPGGVLLDLSGIAKGFAVDAVGDVLREHGCHHALVEIGGELLGMGLKPDGDPWWVDLETPAEAIPPLRIALHQLAVATSGNYVRGRHTIDPRTGHPVDHAVAVSVVHRLAMMADGWATALGVLPFQEAQELAQDGSLIVRIIARTGGAIREWISPALAALIVQTEVMA